MSELQRYYFDTNALIKHYISDKSETEIRRLSCNATVYISNLTYLEFLGVVMRFFRSKELKKKQLSKIIERIEHDIGTNARHRFQLITTQENVFREARNLMRNYGTKYELGTNDALHIVMARAMTPVVIVVTSDGGKNSGKMKGVCKEIGLAVYDPEQPLESTMP